MILLITRTPDGVRIEETCALDQQTANDVHRGRSSAIKCMGGRFWRLKMCQEARRLMWHPISSSPGLVPVPVSDEEKE